MKRPKLKKDVGFKSLTRPKYIDSVKTAETSEVLREARNAWDSLSQWRKTARRCRDYYFGRQWSDVIPNPEAKVAGEPKNITEEQHILRQGKVPLKNNMIRQLGKAIIGQFAGAISEPIAVAADRSEQSLGEMMTVALQYNYTENELKEVDKRLLERLLIGGVCAAKVTHGYNFERQKKDTWIEAVNPNYMFWDADNNDLRLWDLTLIGQIHDAKIEDIIGSFASDKETADAIREVYGKGEGQLLLQTTDNLTSRRVDSLDFALPSDNNLCRVIEVWRRESKERYMCHDWASGELRKVELKDYAKEVEQENAKRIKEAKTFGIHEDDVALIEADRFVDRYWYVRYLTPTGEVLREMESPYEHGSHPYILSLYPNYDGEVHSFVEDILDQQRYINRLITMYDFIMGASAKGVLMIPEDSIPDDMTVEDIADEWVRYNGVIVYKAKPGVAPPQQVSSNSTNIGAMEMLQMQLQLMTEISGISGALQGKQAKSGTASSLYAQESQNSANNLVDILTTFNSFRERRDMKMLQVDLQYYDKPRYINIAGKDYSEEAKHYTPSKVRGVRYDLRISEALDTPAYRQISNDILLQLFQAQQITLEQMLDCGAFPFADKLKRHLARAREEAQQQQAMMQQQMQAQGQTQMSQQGTLPQDAVVPPEIMTQVQQQSNPMFNQIMQR